MGRRRTRPARPQRPSGESLHFAVVEAETDLHHLTAPEAAVQLEFFLSRWSRERPGAVVRVITGRGNRSAGGAVLQPRVRELLKGPLARLVEAYALEPGAGAYRVRVRGED
jgi:DNA-nicking Smr family endonuclease